MNKLFCKIKKLRYNLRCNNMLNKFKQDYYNSYLTIPATTCLSLANHHHLPKTSLTPPPKLLEKAQHTKI